ncbi:MAG: helix-turn-helix transcriptional regulator [Hyphomicrobiaceae bacterium]
MNLTSQRKPHLDRFLRRREVLLATGLPNSTLYDLMSRGLFPKNVRISPRLVGWRESDVIAWQQARRAGEYEELA